MNGLPENAQRFGILIAASHFPEEEKLADLDCPEQDVDGLHEVLGDAEIGGFSEIEVVKNEASHIVLRHIHRMLRKAGKDDLVLIYYAGHGKLDRAGRLHLATVDTVNDELETTSVPTHRIRDLIDNADTGKTALVLDCCYSGAIEKSFLRGDVDEQLNLLAGGRGTFIMTAATGVQTAREEVRDGFGVFTKHLIDGIRGGGADVDGDGVVTMNELYRFVHRAVLADSHQEPMKWDLNVQGELVIARTGRQPREERRRAVRERLFDLADRDLIPDVVFVKALAVSNLSFAETRSGSAACYDALLDRLLDDDLSVGRFINDWLQVPPDDGMDSPAEPAPEPMSESEPPPEPEPSPQPRAADAAAAAEAAFQPSPDQPLDVSWIWKVQLFPRKPTQENLDNLLFYFLTHADEVKARRRAAGKSAYPWFVWLVLLAIGMMFLSMLGGGL